MNIFIFFYCLAITERTILTDGALVSDRSASSNSYGSQSSYSNDNPSTSVLTRSSSTYGSSNNDLLQPKVNAGASFGGSDLGGGSVRYIYNFFSIFLD